MTTTTDPLALERQVCYALAVTNRAVLAVYRPILAEMGITHPQYLVMLALWDRSPRTVGDIAQALTLDAATLSPLLKRLEALGFLTRNRSVDDGRALQVELTAAGRQLRAQALSVPERVIAALDADPQELEALHSILSAVNAKALAAGALSEGRPTNTGALSEGRSIASSPSTSSPSTSSPTSEELS